MKDQIANYLTVFQDSAHVALDAQVCVQCLCSLYSLCSAQSDCHFYSILCLLKYTHAFCMLV